MACVPISNCLRNEQLDIKEEEKRMVSEWSIIRLAVVLSTACRLPSSFAPLSRTTARPARLSFKAANCEPLRSPKSGPPV